MNYLSFRWQLHKLNRIKDKGAKTYDKGIEMAKKLHAPDSDKVAEVIAAGAFELQYTNEEIAHLMTQYLRQKGYQKFISMPEYSIKENEFWEQGNATGKLLMTPKGMTEVRNALRIERKALEESISRWATVIIGIIGALIGLASVLTRK